MTLRRNLYINKQRNDNKNTYKNTYKDIDEEFIEGFSNMNYINNNIGSFNSFNARIILSILLITILILFLYKNPFKN